MENARLLGRAIETGILRCPGCQAAFDHDDAVELSDEGEGGLLVFLRCPKCAEGGFSVIERRMAAIEDLRANGQRAVRAALVGSTCADPECAHPRPPDAIAYCGSDGELAYAQITCAGCGLRSLGVIEASYYLPRTSGRAAGPSVAGVIDTDECIRLQTEIRALQRLPDELVRLLKDGP